eukprot:scaffold5303_cov392-Prasinococcus_capsulatus_cf.AAC.5
MKYINVSARDSPGRGHLRLCAVRHAVGVCAPWHACPSRTLALALGENCDEILVLLPERYLPPDLLPVGELPLGCSILSGSIGHARVLLQTSQRPSQPSPRATMASQASELPLFDLGSGNRNVRHESAILRRLRRRPKPILTSGRRHPPLHGERKGLLLRQAGLAHVLHPQPWAQ